MKKNNFPINISSMKIFYYSLIMFLGVLLLSNHISFAQCTTTTNYFETLGGSSTDQKVTGSNECKTMVMDDQFEKITLILGSIPGESADFTIVNHDATPGENEVAVTNYYYSGNEVETLELGEVGKTAHVCNNAGAITVSWKGVIFKGTVNGNISYNTSCEMTCR
ncbi:MAG: hypothetical protein WCI97_00765 [Bacteroidota bacterium]